MIDTLNLSIKEGTPIYIGQNNIDHIKSRHEYEFDLYFNRIEEIIKEPDFIGKDPKNGSIDFVKLYNWGSDYVQLAIRVTGKGNYIARTLFMLATYKAEKYIKQGTLIDVRKH